MNLADITVVLPIYGESPFLIPSLLSIEELLILGSSLLIIDDGGIPFPVSLMLENWIENNPGFKITINKNATNVGLFKSLNQNVDQVDTSWLVFLCSDDVLLKGAASVLSTMQLSGQVELIISRFHSINEDCTTRFDDCASQYSHITQKGNTLNSTQMLASMLRFGSLNGNFTGMLLTKKLWNRTGGFNSNWVHAADWEWLVRAAEMTYTYINEIPFAAVRTHNGQLSNSNLLKGATISECSVVIRRLKNHPMLLNKYPTHWWAACLIQYQAWNLIKLTSTTLDLPGFFNLLKYIQQVSPIWLVCLAMAASVPERIIRHLQMMQVSSTMMQRRP